MHFKFKTEPAPLTCDCLDLLLAPPPRLALLGGGPGHRSGDRRVAGEKVALEVQRKLGNVLDWHRGPGEGGDGTGWAGDSVQSTRSYGPSLEREYWNICPPKPSTRKSSLHSPLAPDRSPHAREGCAALSSHLNPWAKEASVKLLTRYWQKAAPAEGLALSSIATRAYRRGPRQGGEGLALRRTRTLHRQPSYQNSRRCLSFP